MFPAAALIVMMLVILNLCVWRMRPVTFHVQSSWRTGTCIYFKSEKTCECRTVLMDRLSPANHFLSNWGNIGWQSWSENPHALSSSLSNLPQSRADMWWSVIFRSLRSKCPTALCFNATVSSNSMKEINSNTNYMKEIKISLHP